MVTMRLGGITTSVGPRDVDFYSRAGYQVVDEGKAVEAAPPSVVTAETEPTGEVEPVEVSPEPDATPVVDEGKAVEAAPKQPRSKKVG